ncbi:MAG: hypothetical protein FWF18_03040, partial [Dehalococcoidia bacterium]|nr:hypothetical protein [Dehalococcoidia bacterium]
YEICGDFYEEYPLNEICMGDNRNYLVRVMVPIRKKRGKKASKAEAPVAKVINPCWRNEPVSNEASGGGGE